MRYPITPQRSRDAKTVLPAPFACKEQSIVFASFAGELRSGSDFQDEFELLPSLLLGENSGSGDWDGTIEEIGDEFVHHVSADVR